jgi:DNA modification methylase
MPGQGPPPYLDPKAQAEALTAFIAKHARPYDPATDDYDRQPFTSDIREGKNDPTYNAHSYHTKVPPRGIVPFILHYTKPGDIVLDLFCGSGMTGVAAQMCAQPPTDILDSFPELKDRIGARACILNDLSPAACHIAYNYNTPVDVEGLNREFARITAAVKTEFEWLYGTEHYEPAVDLYDPANPEVASRLKNPPPDSPSRTLLGGEELTWELLSKDEVEKRLGYLVSELPRNEVWGDLDVSNVTQWICIPARIQFTIWSDVYRCEGFVKLEEPTGKISTRGKNVGKPITRTKHVSRGCSLEFVLYEVAMDKDSTKVFENFKCPSCNQEWTVDDLTPLRAEPCEVVYQYVGVRTRSDGSFALSKVRRTLTKLDHERLNEIAATPIPYWYPRTPLVPGEQGNPFINRGLNSVDKLYTARNLFASARLWKEFEEVSDGRIRKALEFMFTSISARSLTKMTRYRKRGYEALSLRLFIPHFQAELNPLKVLEGKSKDITDYFQANTLHATAAQVMTGPAQELQWLSDSSIDFVFADPPFGRNIAYAELNILWEAWLGRVTEVDKEAITSGGRKLDVNSYSEKMRGAFREMFRVLKPGRFAMIEFNNGDPKLGLFECVKVAALAAGFEITNMMILDKEQKSFNQVVGVMRGEDTVDKDVIFNLRKPALVRNATQLETFDLDQQIAEAVRQHLSTLPQRIGADPNRYSDEHRTTATINSMLMNTLIPRGISVDRLNLPFIEQVCARYFRKIGQHWYLRGESAGAGNGQSLIEKEVSVKDEITAIAWLRQKISLQPMLAGELKPLWMRATGLLPAAMSQELSMDDLLSENFWRDAGTNRWREPPGDEREKMNDDRSIRVLHDADRYIAGSLHRTTTDAERCEWIDVLFKASRQVEDGDMQSAPALRGFDASEAYRVITRLFQSVLREEVAADAYTRAQKQAAVASSRISQNVRDDEELRRTEGAKLKGPSLFDGVD